MKNPFYLPLWFIGARFFGKRNPLQTVLFISEKCNLSCKHCSIYNHVNPKIKTIAQIEDELRYSYGLGSRFVDFEGGEPMIWRDGENTINDLITLAKTIGFFSATVTTNAQINFEGLTADSVWVSLDGVGKYHDVVRGEGSFDRLEKNIATAKHKELSVNMVINRLNITSVEETIQYAKDNPAIRLIALNFHTPFAGTESLQVTEQQRTKIIDLIISYKKKGYPIMNSLSALMLMKKKSFPRNCWVTNFIMANGVRYQECQGKTEGVGENCGFGMAAEVQSVFSLKPDTIWSGIKLRMLS